MRRPGLIARRPAQRLPLAGRSEVRRVRPAMIRERARSASSRQATAAVSPAKVDADHGRAWLPEGAPVDRGSLELRAPAPEIGEELRARAKLAGLSQASAGCERRDVARSVEPARAGIAPGRELRSGESSSDGRRPAPRRPVLPGRRPGSRRRRSLALLERFRAPLAARHALGNRGAVADPRRSPGVGRRRRVARPSSRLRGRDEAWGNCKPSNVDSVSSFGTAESTS